MNLGILISYWHYKDVDVAKRLSDVFPNKNVPVFADSGAFSAMTTGATVDIDKYAEWLHKWKHLFAVYSNLDVIMNAERTWQNQLHLEQMHGLQPLPVFHVREEFRWLEMYAEKYDYIALGVAGMQQRKTNIMKWLTKCFTVARDKRLHGFGLTDWMHLPIFPWYSVDSTTWMMGAKYGSQLIFANNKLHQQRAEKLPKHHRDLAMLGFTVDEAIAATRGDTAMSKRIAIASFEKTQRKIQEKNKSFHAIYLAGFL